MLNDKHDSYSVNSLLICAQAALLGGTASNHDVINLLDVAQDIISSTMNSFTDSSAPGANVDLFTKEVSAREGANKQVISSQADSLIKISRIWADFFPANTSNQPI
ncbi:hypothetical protein M8679_25745 [Escherichia coli]|nr:hypothetical protein [Escherichia coli]